MEICHIIGGFLPHLFNLDLEVEMKVSANFHIFLMIFQLKILIFPIVTNSLNVKWLLKKK